MPLILVDLDNTLTDRDAAFREAVAAFLAGHGLPAADLSWITDLDAGGYTPREVVAAALSERYEGAAIRPLLDNGAADRVVLTKETEQALTTAAARGWTCVIVTNGRTAQQEAKIRPSSGRQPLTAPAVRPLTM